MNVFSDLYNNSLIIPGEETTHENNFPFQAFIALEKSYFESIDEQLAARTTLQLQLPEVSQTVKQLGSSVVYTMTYRSLVYTMTYSSLVYTMTYRSLVYTMTYSSLVYTMTYSSLV